MHHLSAAILVLALSFLVSCGGGGSEQAKDARVSAGTTAGGSVPADAGGVRQRIVEAAAQEGGVLAVLGPPTFAAEGVRELQEAFNRHYGLSVDFEYTPAPSMIREVARVITELAAGHPPTWDLLLVTDAHYATFYTNGVLDKTDWAALGITNLQSIIYEGGALVLSTQFVAPAYNSNLVRPEEAPKSWNDLLDARWRGRLGLSSATHHWGRLAQAWGEERTSRFVEGLAAQEPTLGRIPDLNTRLMLGEFAVLATMLDSHAEEARQAGAPIVLVDTVQPILAPQYNVGILQGVKRPNLARLLAAYLVTPEAQANWERALGQTSMHIEGTAAWRYAQGKELLPLNPNFAIEQLDDLSQKYGRMVGYR